MTSGHDRMGGCVLEEQECEFQELPIFSGVEADVIETFIRKVGGYVQQFQKGARIPYTHGSDPCIGIVLGGLIHVLLTDSSGCEVLGYELKDGALFGNVWAVVGTDVCSNMMLEMRKKTSVLWMPYRNLERAFGKPGRVQGIVARNMFAILSRMMFALLQQIEVLSQHTLRERLRLYLMHQGKAQKTRKVQVPGRVRLAKILGCNRSALTREIGRMEDEGVLACGGDWMELKHE